MESSKQEESTSNTAASSGFTSKRAKKEEAKRLKRKLIEESGGVRPRPNKDTNTNTGEDKSPNKKKKKNKKNKGSTTVKTTFFAKGAGGKTESAEEHSNNNNNNNNNGASQQHSTSSHYYTNDKMGDDRHRFGRVMEQVPCINKPRYSTLSIAVPGSVVANCQTRELRTVVVGQIARAAAVYHVDEIIVFDDHLSSEKNHRDVYSFDRRNRRNDKKNHDDDNHKDKAKNENQDEGPPTIRKKSDPHTFMARILQYCECPQYLRRAFFPMHPDLQFAGLLPPLDAPHHVRSGERSKYREGVVMDKTSPGGMSLVNVGIFKTPVEIDRVLTPGIRCTVELDVKTAYDKKGSVQGKVVSPNAPKEDDGTYWGYTTRLASSIKAVFDECPYENGYDLKIGTSERGDVTVDDVNPPFKIPQYKHSLIVFGGVAGIEECVDADEGMKLAGKDSKKLFDVWVNTCPFQGSRTIRTEEAVLLSLARLRPHFLQNNESPGALELIKHDTSNEKKEVKEVDPIEFSDESPSDESSDEE